VAFEKGAVLYDAGCGSDSFYFIREGVVSLGAVSSDGHEIIYDLRKGGDVVGELCVSGAMRHDRAVALENTQAVVVPYQEIVTALQQNCSALLDVLRLFATALLSAYDQTELLLIRDIAQRLIKTFQHLARDFGHESGGLTELDTYLTQEELARMVGASRERVSSALNGLRERGLIQYSRGGRLLMNVVALEGYSRSALETDRDIAPVASAF